MTNEVFQRFSCMLRKCCVSYVTTIHPHTITRRPRWVWSWDLHFPFSVWNQAEAVWLSWYFLSSCNRTWPTTSITCNLDLLLDHCLITLCHYSENLHLTEKDTHIDFPEDDFIICLLLPCRVSFCSQTVFSALLFYGSLAILISFVLCNIVKKKKGFWFEHDETPAVKGAKTFFEYIILICWIKVWMIEWILTNRTGLKWCKRKNIQIWSI